MSSDREKIVNIILSSDVTRGVTIHAKRKRAEKITDDILTVFAKTIYQLLKRLNDVDSGAWGESEDK